MEQLLITDQLQSDITSVLALGIVAFALAILLTPIYTRFAFSRKWWKVPRTTAITGEKAPILTKLHAAKHRRHLPTMAGTITVISVLLVTLVFNLSRSQTYLPLAAMIGAALVGLADDIINIRGYGRGMAGMNSKLKLLLILVVATLGGLYFYFKLGYHSVQLTFIGDIDIGWLLIPLFIAVVVSTANAVNISDGLDGLAGGLLVSAFGAYTLIALIQGNVGIAGFSAAMVGALVAYTWFNIFPARFMMGDIGSFAFGTALGVIAMLTNTVLLLVVIGGVFVIEAGSSLVQILSKKLLGRKIFTSAPIHHHLEAMGWPETKVTMRFWVIGWMCAITGMFLAIIGGHL